MASLLLCLLCACEGKKENPPAERVSIDNLPGEMLQMDTLLRFRDPEPPNLYMLNDTMVLVTFRGDGSLLRIYYTDSRASKLFQVKSKEGRPVISPDTTLYASVSYLGDATSIWYDYVVEKGVLRLNDFTRMRLGENTPEEVAQVDTDKFAFIGRYKNGLFALWNRSAKELEQFGDHPVRQEIYMNPFMHYSRGYMSAYEDQLVYTSEFFGFISSYQYRKGKLKKLWEKQLTDYLYEVKPSSYEFDDRHCSGFSDVYLTPTHIYGLYNGYSRETAGEPVNSILVFDRQGNPLAHHRLPDEMRKIAVDSKGEYLYATYSPYMNECYLVRFRLP